MRLSLFRFLRLVCTWHVIVVSKATFFGCLYKCFLRFSLWNHSFVIYSQLSFVFVLVLLLVFELFPVRFACGPHISDQVRIYSFMQEVVLSKILYSTLVWSPQTVFDVLNCVVCLNVYSPRLLVNNVAHNIKWWLDLRSMKTGQQRSDDFAQAWITYENILSSPPMIDSTSFFILGQIIIRLEFSDFHLVLFLFFFVQHIGCQAW